LIYLYHDDDIIRAEVWAALSERLREQQQLPSSQLNTTDFQALSAMLEKHIDAFGLEQSKCRLSRLTPMTVVLKDPHAPPCIAKARNLGPRQLEFLRTKLQDLEAIGMIRRARNPLFSSAVFVVPKKQADQYRMVIDMRPLNDLVLKSALPFPNLDAQLQCLGDTAHYGTFDVLSGFDMLTTHEQSQQYFGITTVFGTYYLVGAPMGFVNTPQVYSDRIVNEVLQPSQLFMQSRRGVLQWLDDSLLYSTDFKSYLQLLDAFLTNLEHVAVRLSVKKCVFYTRTAIWCGRSITAAKISFEERFYETITNMQRPRTASELAQALYIANWLSPTIPSLAHVARPLRNFMEAIFAQRGGARTKKSIIGIQLDAQGWNAKHDAAWEAFRQAIANYVELSVYDFNAELCIFTDASDYHWSAVITQTSSEELMLPIAQQQHALLGIFSGDFTGSQMNWHISSKELFPVVMNLQRLDWLFQGHGRKFHLYVDHYNLRAVLKPGTDASKTTLSRLYRWGIILQGFDFKVHNIPSEDNFLADAVSRWATPHPPAAPTTIRALAARIQHPTLKGWQSFVKTRLSYLTPTQHDSDWIPLDLSAVSAAQDTYFAENSPSPTFIRDEARSIWITRQHRRIIIPPAIMELFILSAHIGFGHPSNSSLTDRMRQYHFLSDPQPVLQLISRLCLHCEKYPRLIRRSYTQQIHAQTRNQVLHSDYLQLPGGYLLVIVDDLSRKVELFEADAPTADVVAQALTWWKARFSLPQDAMLITDNGSHFSNNLLRLLTSKLRMDHRFTVAYSPWTNGAAEVANRQILRILRPILSEYRLQDTQWPSLLPMLQHLLNSTPGPHHLSPNEIFLGTPPDDQLLLPVMHEGGVREPLSTTAVQDGARALRGLLDQLAQDTFPVRDKLRAAALTRLNARRGVADINYQIGDWVLLANMRIGSTRYKTRLSWLGPSI